MKENFTIFGFLFFVLIGSSAVMAQEKKASKEFKPVAIMHEIDKPEGMAVIGNILYVSKYHSNGSIIKYDIAKKVVLGKIAEGLNYPAGMLAFKDQLIVLEYGTGSMFLVHPESGQKEVIATGFSHPAAVILFNDQLLVSDFGTGIIYSVNQNTYEKAVFAKGLASPAGLAILKNNIYVVEWGMRRISKIKEDGTKKILETEGLSSPWGLMVYQDELYVAENGSNEISKVAEVKVPIQNSTTVDLDDKMNSNQDSITIWKVMSMNCIGLNHPEAFCVSDRGIYVSEWKSKEVSEIRLNSPPKGELILAGKAKLQNVLTAEPQNIQDEDGLGPFSYRWQIANRPESEIWEYIDGKKLEYTLKNESFAGKYIRAELSYIDSGGIEEFVYSDAELITKPLAPEVLLSFYPEKVLVPGDTLTLIAEIKVLDEDARPDKVEFYSDDLLLITTGTAPFSYRFVVQDNKTTKGYIDQLSIKAKGYDSYGLFGEDVKTVFVTNEQNWESELLSLLNSTDEAISVFPNPASDIINIVHNKKESFKIRLIDMNKKVVLSAVITNGFKILDFSKLTPGAYIIEYTIGNETKAEKIIKI